MLCKKCGGRTKIFNTRSSEKNNNNKIPNKYSELPKPFTYRDHKCYDCSYIFQTIEITADNIDNFMEATEKKIKEALIEKTIKAIDKI